MKTISPGHSALSVCVAAAVLAGCGGATQFPNPAAQTPPGNTDGVYGPASLSIVGSNRPDSGGKVERLRARGDRVKGHCGGDGFVWGCLVRVRGTAVGPYPGAFFARYQYQESTVSDHTYWSFKEHFIISSGVFKIRGTIEGGGSGGISIPGVYQYTTTDGYSGSVKIQTLGGVTVGPDADFREIFHGM
jgi:hypothetical protein